MEKAPRYEVAVWDKQMRGVVSHACGCNHRTITGAVRCKHRLTRRQPSYWRGAQIVTRLNGRPIVSTPDTLVGDAELSVAGY